MKSLVIRPSPMPFWIGSYTMHTASSCPARACESNVPSPSRKQPRLDGSIITIHSLRRPRVHLRWPASRRNRGRNKFGTGGRLHVGMGGRHHLNTQSGKRTRSHGDGPNVVHDPRHPRISAHNPPISLGRSARSLARQPASYCHAATPTP